MINIFMKLYFNISRFFNNKKNFCNAIVQLINLVFSILLMLSDGIFNKAVSWCLIIFSFIVSIKFNRTLYTLFKSLYRILIENKKFKIGFCIFIGIFAIAPLIVRWVKTGKFAFIYLFDNCFSNISGAAIVIFMLLKFCEINSKCNNLDVLLESNNEWFIIFLFGFVDATLLIIDNYTKIINSCFDVANTFYLGVVIFTGFNIVSLYLFQICGKQPLNINNSNEPITLYPLSVLVSCFTFLFFHAFATFMNFGNNDFLILLGNAIAISIAEGFGYMFIKKYISFSDGKVKKIKNIKLSNVLIFVVLQILIAIAATVACLCRIFKNNLNFELQSDQLIVCVSVIAIALIICAFLNYLQNKNQFSGYVNKEEIFKIINDYINNTDVYKELIYCPIFDKCECKEKSLTIIKVYIIMYLFKLEKSQIKNEILNNNKMQSFLEINTNSDTVNEIINQAERYGEETQYSEKIMENINNLIKENNLKGKYVISVEYVYKTKC